MILMLIVMMIMSNELYDDGGVDNAIDFWLLAEKNYDYKIDGL